MTMFSVGGHRIEIVVAMMVTSAIRDARLSGKRCAPIDAKIDLPQAYAIQASIFAEVAQPIAGWKIGLTGDAPRKAKGADAPAAGRLAQADILSSPALAPISTGDHYVEAELVVRFGTALPASDAPFTAAQVAAAIDAVHVGIELVTSRFAPDDLPLGLLIADNCMADRLVIGDKIADGWQVQFADMVMTLNGPGDESRDGTTAAVMGDPLQAITWLANWLADNDLALEAGQWVSSGTCTGVKPVAAGDRVCAELAGLGRATVEFTSES